MYRSRRRMPIGGNWHRCCAIAAADNDALWGGGGRAGCGGDADAPGGDRTPPPSPSRSRCAVHCRRGAACRLTTPVTRHAPHRPLVRMVVMLPLLRHLSLRHRLLCLSSIRLVVTSRSFSHRHLPSAGSSASHRAVASCHGIIKEEGVGASGDDDEQ